MKCGFRTIDLSTEPNFIDILLNLPLDCGQLKILYQLLFRPTNDYINENRGSGSEEIENILFKVASDTAFDLDILFEVVNTFLKEEFLEKVKHVLDNLNQNE